VAGGQAKKTKDWFDEKKERGNEGCKKGGGFTL